MTMEVMLSTAFGRSVDVQGEKEGELYEAADGALLYSPDNKESLLDSSRFFLRD